MQITIHTKIKKTMMNLVIVVFPAKEDKFEELKNTLKVALVDTRAFKGCISVETYEEESSNTIFLIEDWETLDDHSKYASWRAETGLADVMEPLLNGGAKALKMIRCGSSLEI